MDGKPDRQKDPQEHRWLPIHELIKILGHQLRVRILAILMERMASPTEIAKELSSSVPRVSHHISVLVEGGLIKEDHQEERRGAITHFYRAVEPTLIPPAILRRDLLELQNEPFADIIKSFLDDVSRSVEEGVFSEPLDNLELLPLVLDDLGIEELNERAQSFLDSATAVQEAVRKRSLGRQSKRPPAAIEPDRVSRRLFLLVSNLRGIAQLDPLGNV